ncbi:nuclear receptor coactivator 7-like isoform X2 [Amphibalanus amphitrite]|uniref:nuclear receptor coactivator 7-like isoform X2 n=1 Tax=Amphibalanus amphitrite TaxID=1232801 RepID=UPI001C9217A3|nr:nuclear receptor coactivator 7-like isoform X2 [Amphibalanus amphitrite]
MGPLLVTDSVSDSPGRAHVCSGAAGGAAGQSRSCRGAGSMERSTLGGSVSVAASAPAPVTSLGDGAALTAGLDSSGDSLPRCEDSDQSGPSAVRHREDSGYAAGSERPRAASGDAGRADSTLTDLERSAASGTDSGKQSGDEEDDVFGADGEEEEAFCRCEHADWESDAAPAADFGTSVESCYSACNFYSADAEWSSSMMDSMYSTNSDRTLLGDCPCPRDGDCCCGQSAPLADSRSESGSDADAESEAEDPRGVSISGLSERMVRLMANVSENLSERRRMEEVAGSFHASSPRRQESLFNSLGGAQPCRVGNKELTKRYDTKDVLGVAFEQARQTRRMCGAGGGPDAEDFGRFARFSECGSELSASSSEPGLNRSARERTSSSELNSSFDTVSDDYLLEAVGRERGRLHDRLSFSSVQSDSSIEVLDLETTGDFPRGFRFAGAPPLELPEPLARREQLADKLRHVSGESALSQSTVVESRERELDAVEEIEVLVDEDPPPATAEPGKRNLLHRFLDMTADLLAGAPREGDDVRPRATLARSNSTVDRRGSVSGPRSRPRAATVHCRHCLKTREQEAEQRCRTGSWQPELPTQPERPDTDGTDTGKSQSVESGGGSGQRPAAGGRQSSAMAAPGTGPGLAQRSLDSVWPPSLSRGSSTASQPEKLDKPPTLVKYAVQERDTLTSIAARFDCLPTELVKANRLNARLVFPGQVLLVPSRVADQPPAATTAAADDAAAGGAQKEAGVEERAAHSGETQAAAKGTSTGADPELDKDCLMKYVKIKTRHITDGQGVVTGTLLVTPNCLMFDPNVSDPLVLEHGADKYCVMVPMDYIVSAALYTDIAHMKVKDRGNIPLPDLPAPEVYHAPPKGTPSPSATPAPAPTPTPAPAPAPAGEQSASDSAEGRTEPIEAGPAAQEPPAAPEGEERAPLQEQESTEEPGQEADGGSLSKELTFPELSLRSGSQEEEEPAEPRDTAAFPKAFDCGLVTPETALGDGDGAQGRPAPPADREAAERGETGEPADRRSVQFTQRAESHPDELDETKKQKLLKRLSHPLTWMESLSGTQDREPTPSSAPPHIENIPKSMLSNVVSSVSSVSSALVSSPRYIVDLGSGLLSSLSPAEMEQTAGQGGVAPAAPAPAAAPAAESAGGGGRTGTDEDGRREGNSTFYSERSSVDRKPKSQGSFGGYKNLVSMDEMPSLFTSFDKLIPKPSKAADDPPLYLCLIMGKRRGRKIRKTVRILSYGEEKLRSEFWFSIPREKCDQLYHFIQYWAPEIYGSLETTKPEERGFELVDSDSDIWECEEGDATASSDAAPGESGLMDLPKQLPKQSWEVIKAPYVKLYSMIKSQTSATSEEEFSEMGGMSDELRRALCSNSMTSMDMEFVPDLIGKSELLTDDIRKKLCKKIPPRVEGHPWSLIFSSSEHGFSLKSLYRKSSAYECPMLLFVQDTDEQIFGALCSTPIHMSEHYYGTGETFLFTFHEGFRTFAWSGENLYFVRGSPDGLEFGSGDGHYGLYLDGDLYRGRTQRCLTYNNDPLTGSTDFIVRAVELWALT